MSEESIKIEPATNYYHQPVPLCRLCLHEYSDDDLQEIFSRGSDWKKRITRAVGIKPNRNDLATRLCSTCRMMVDLIVSFQIICQHTERLLVKGHTLSGDHWKQASGMIDSLWGSVERQREAVLEAEDSIKNRPLQTAQIVNVTVPDDGLCHFLDETKEKEEGDIHDIDIKEEPIDNDDQDFIFQSESDTEAQDEKEQPNVKQVARKPSHSSRKLKNEKVMCDTCGELVSQVCLEGHLNRHLGVKPFVCEIDGCGRRLHSKYSLQQHRHLHKSIMRFYDCPDCGKRIKGTNCWMRHRKLHTEDPKHECDVCGKKFRRKFGLKLHSVVHTGVALFPCEICGKRFTVKHNLGAHYKTHIRNGTFPNQLSTGPHVDLKANEML